MKEIHCSEISVSPDLPLYHVGAPLDLGERPALFYFALSGPDSLCLDPFNQPVQFLLKDRIRIFSLTLPGHEQNLPAKDALKIWTEEMRSGRDPIGDFLDNAQRAIEYAFQKRLVAPGKCAVAGLSRGAFIAAHLAAREPRINALLGFAPLTRLNLAKEFHDMKDHPLVESYNLMKLAPQLIHKPCRFYIGNRDTRVSTRACFDFVEAIADAAHRERLRTAPAELIIGPSLGHQGHGTSPETFSHGSDWIAEILNIHV